MGPGGFADFVEHAEGAGWSFPAGHSHCNRIAAQQLPLLDQQQLTAAAMQHQMPPSATDHACRQLGELQLQRTQGMVGITEGAGLQRGRYSHQR